MLNSLVLRWTVYNLVIRNCRSKLCQANNRVVCGLEVLKRLAQEILQPGQIRKGEVVCRYERPSFSKSQAEDEKPEQTCGNSRNK